MPKSWNVKGNIAGLGTKLHRAESHGVLDSIEIVMGLKEGWLVMKKPHVTVPFLCSRFFRFSNFFFFFSKRE